MKLALDENLPPSLAHALNALLLPWHGSALSIPERFGQGTIDIDWITQLNSETGWAVLTADRKLRTRPHERKALLESGMIVFVLAPGWNQESYWPKAAGIIRWVPNMIATMTLFRPPALLAIPHRWKPDVIKPFR